jgi:hypothetical protein
MFSAYLPLAVFHLAYPVLPVQLAADALHRLIALFF